MRLRVLAVGKLKDAGLEKACKNVAATPLRRWYFVEPFRARTCLYFGRSLRYFIFSALTGLLFMWWIVVGKMYSLWFDITMSDASTCGDISDVLELVAKQSPLVEE